jgi:hypothetical protein
MKDFCKNNINHDIAWAYYYCFSRHEQDETSHCLHWIISQLCRQARYIPDDICKSYRENERPSVTKLTIALSILLRRFKHVYLVIDALDESQNRSNLLQMLVRLTKDYNYPNLQLIAMSRKEMDIETALKDVFTSISLSNPRVDEDIKVYIQSHLQHDRKFDTWPNWLKTETENALVEKARGMYVIFKPKQKQCPN